MKMESQVIANQNAAVKFHWVLYLLPVSGRKKTMVKEYLRPFYITIEIAINLWIVVEDKKKQEVLDHSFWFSISRNKVALGEPGAGVIKLNHFNIKYIKEPINIIRNTFVDTKNSNHRKNNCANISILYTHLFSFLSFIWLKVK